jgi:hypothetical protein
VDLAVAVEAVKEASGVEEAAAGREAIKEVLVEAAVEQVVPAEKVEVSAVVAEAVVEIDNLPINTHIFFRKDRQNG